MKIFIFILFLIIAFILGYQTRKVVVRAKVLLRKKIISEYLAEENNRKNEKWEKIKYLLDENVEKPQNDKNDL